MHERREWARYVKSAAALTGLVAALSVAASPTRAEPSGEEILDRAFRQRYDVDMTADIELAMRDRAGREHRRKFAAASKQIDGRLHSVGKIDWPEYLRDMAILTIEAEGRGHDAFVYMPSLGRVRRISSAQKGDAFFGTDVTYEDLERRRASDFRVEEVGGAEIAGEAAWRLRAVPASALSYARAEFFVAKADFALLEMRYFRESEAEPYRVVTAEREHMLVEGGHIVPTHFVVENRRRHTRTEATFRNVAVNPEIDDRLFSVSVLERNPNLRSRRSVAEAAEAAAAGAR
ncbi:MAG: outer membrane lipoprotein-sorting protein [Myxococcales bacterium]|nr:outer membrane lipoprotein-sorting protein [Myxococcales bacterium]